MVQPKIANLALQGGGAHGAFTWGVLDRLLEEPGFQIDGVTATSSGAMNAVVLAYGLTCGGREGAKRALADFWYRISQAGKNTLLQSWWSGPLTNNHGLEQSPAFLFFDMMTRVLSPYQFNPLNYNPLQSVIESVVDFERLRNDCAIKLFLSATNVRTGKVRVFDNNEVSAKAVLASACLPLMYQAVEIDNEFFWDGGYVGNPALFPLIYNCDSRDIVIIHINPTERHDIPRTAPEILSRINEISFNSSLYREMRAIAFVTKLIEDRMIADENFKHMLVHAIEADDVMQGLGVSSKFNPDWKFLTHLHDIGHERADRWLKAHLDSVGRASTVDIRAKYL